MSKFFIDRPVLANVLAILFVLIGGEIYLVFALALLLVYLCLAGQYESWLAPLSVSLAVPLSLIGPAIVLEMLRLPNNLYTQIGMVLLIALSAKNAILIVEVARQRRAAGRTILEAAVDAAETRFRSILMTSFAFILGVTPLIFASGAGAAARISVGLAVFSGMTASTCLTVLVVPSYFVLMQGLEERRRRRAAALAATEDSAPRRGHAMERAGPPETPSSRLL
jgi:hydrophobic/amphiphilic exporter-1 (mainly G- bacteria), HAE1 family